MKTIGLIGGMSWESSAEYYRLTNLLAKERLGGHANAKSLMLTVNFAEIEPLQYKQDWARMAAEMQTAARNLEAGGADCIVLCTNTMHKVADQTGFTTATCRPSMRSRSRHRVTTSGS
jgi:aspartate racemase